MSLPGTDRIYTGAESIPINTRVLNETGRPPDYVLT